MTQPLKLSFLRSASKHEQLPNSIAEIALVGRSNVGKSTLINSLAAQNGLARTSKTPGATQLLNAYNLRSEGSKQEDEHAGSGRWLVDLPGYGYAKMSKNKQQQMADMINDYMYERETLVAVMQLFDANVGPTELDLESVDWLRTLEVEIVLVGTKDDKIKSSKRSKQHSVCAEKFGVKSGDIIWTSSSKGTGIDKVRSCVYNLLNG